MYQTLLSDSSLYRLLFRIDQYVALEVKARGCGCGGRLHSARYPRKPRGIPADLEYEYGHRFSFCCAEEGCRHRTTPVSFRFLGRKVFVSAAVVLVTVLRHGPTPKRIVKLRELVGVSARTICRWRWWWQDTLVRMPFWKAARGFLQVPIDESSLPLSLLESFPVHPAKRKLLRLLRFICPVTTSGRVVQKI